jgi:hypothetical protein
MRDLSSGMTFFMKFIFVGVWIVGFGVGTLALWSSPNAQVEAQWQFAGAWVAGSALIWWACARLKRVRVDGQALYISNFLKEISVPLGMIVDVTENTWVNIHPVTVHFRAPTEFGSKITFMPPARFLAMFSSDPVVAELKRLAAISPP